MKEVRVCLNEDCSKYELIYINENLTTEEILKLICSKYGYEGWIGYEINPN